MNCLRNGLVLLAGMLILATQSFAATLAAQFKADGSAVIVNGVTVFHLSTSAAGLTPAQRAHALVERLSEMPTWGDVTIRPDGEDRVLVVSGESVLTVSKDEAARHGTTPAALAQAWADKLKEAISLPPLKVSDNFVRLPLGSTETVRILGSAASSAHAEISPENVATIKRVSDGVQISARSFGHAIVTIESGREAENIDVQVRPYAANFPQTLTAFVTGAPATATTVQGVVEAALKTQLAAAPSAHWSYQPVHATEVMPGRSASYTVKAWAAGPEAFPSGGMVTVLVKNAALPEKTDDSLWYSNDPENIKQPGALFSDSLKVGSSARVLYHHVNGTTQDLYIRADVVNDSDKPAKIEIIPGDSKPDRNPVKAGLLAADQFFRNWVYGSGEVVTIPAKAAMPISFRRLSPGETSSGLCSVRLVEGSDEVLVRVDAFPSFPIDPKWQNAIYSSTPWHEVGTHPLNDFDRAPFEANPHVYPKPYSEEQVSYEFGGRFATVRIGQKPIARFDADGSLDGNFGVIYTVKADLKNPTQFPADIEIAFEASAGYTAGLFTLDGTYVKIHGLQPKGQMRLAKIHLAPGASRRLDITTLPISGSSYPATLIIRPVDTTAAVSGTNPPHGS